MDLINNPERRMSSLEIAELTGKPHNDVLKAIRAMEPAWEKINGGKFSLVKYRDKKGEMRPCYQLTKTECLYIATKFNDEARARLVLRWEELEKERIAEERNPDLSISKAVRNYRRMGKSDKWIATRTQSVVQRYEYTDTLKAHGVTGKGYAQCTNAIYKPLLGGTKGSVSKERGLAKHANLRDNLSMTELASVMLSEALASERIEQFDARGNDPCAMESYQSAFLVGEAVRANRKHFVPKVQ